MLSIVVPIYNEEKIIDELLGRMRMALNSLDTKYELVFIDDGSTDSSLFKLLKLKSDFSELKVVQLSRNYGHQAAFTAGLSVSEGSLIVLMDGDLQDPPELIKSMYEKITSDPNIDVVYARRISKKESLVRNFFMNVFHEIFGRIKIDKTVEDVGNFSIFRRTVADAMLAYREKSRYLPGIRFHVGFKQEYVLYARDERFAGAPKMSYRKLTNLALDALFSFSDYPVRFMLILGLVGILVSLLGIIYVLISKLTGIAPFGWSSTLFFISFFASLQITFLGLLGEYIHRIYKEVQDRPLFIIKKIFR